MKATIKRVLILLTTSRAHLKLAHCCLLPVIGNILDNGKARAAVGAVNKRITVATVLRVKQFPEAIVAGRNVSGNWDEFIALVCTLQNKKVGIVDRCEVVVTVYGFNGG